MLELKRPLVVIDTETTGVHPQVDRVCQIGLIKVYPDGRENEWQTLVNPTVPIPIEATAIHGITDVHVMNAPTFKDIASKLAGGLVGCDIGGFNVRFDIQMLRAEFERVGGRAVLDGAKIVDSFRIFMQHYKRDLTAAVREYLGEDLPDAHDALVDTRAAWRVLQAQLERHPDLPRDVESLHKLFFETPAQGHLDVDGKLAWRHDEATINFGQKFPGVPLRQVDRGYLEWMLKSEFSETVKHVIREALAGRYPRRDR